MSQCLLIIHVTLSEGHFNLKTRFYKPSASRGLLAKGPEKGMSEVDSSLRGAVNNVLLGP